MSEIEFEPLEPLEPPKKTPPGDTVAFWTWMEDITTHHQLQAIEAAKKHPPLDRPYRPRLDPDEAPPIAPAD